MADNIEKNDSWAFLLSATTEGVIDISSVIVNPAWLNAVTLEDNKINQSGCLESNADLLARTNGAWSFEGDLSAAALIIASVRSIH